MRADKFTWALRLPSVAISGRKKNNNNPLPMFCLTKPSSPRSSFFFPLLVGVFASGLFGLTPLKAITLTGATGRAVEFHLIKEATPKGLTVQLVAEGPVIGVTWEKLDLKALEREQQLIFAAYERAIAGETVELNLASGAMPAAAPASPSQAETPDTAKYPGWLDTKVGKIEFMLQMPASKPRGILLVSLDDFGRSFRYLYGSQDRGKGPWAEFQTKHDFALLSYEVDAGGQGGDPTKIDEFVFADKGSGRALESALGNFATKLKQPELLKLPFAIFGSERTGAAFAYSYLHYKPERILAAVISKGAFYDSAPRPETTKVPVLFIWGEYCKKHELWGSENHAESVLAKASPLKPNWTNGREFRGNSDLNPGMEYFGKQYLLEMIKSRLPEKKSGGVAVAAPDGGEAPEGGTATPSDAGALFDEIDRMKGYKGNVETGEMTKITDPATAMGEDETFIPSEAVGNLWKKFVLGELEPPTPGQ